MPTILIITSAWLMVIGCLLLAIGQWRKHMHLKNSPPPYLTDELQRPLTAEEQRELEAQVNAIFSSGRKDTINIAKEDRRFYDQASDDHSA